MKKEQHQPETERTPHIVQQKVAGLVLVTLLLEREINLYKSVIISVSVIQSNGMF